ncbi:uncharacterized protein LOC128195543 [Vigna angularis]|uniref:uncharacterized protein LOC128195543 n=1 Tax=Phaseolus angularis TaxID=3914 RepID=UPI0022B36E42|nr:uncharacterized protein LOC128195543 [Vigna angularis]
MARPTRSLLFLAAIILLSVEAESRYEKTMKESKVMDLTELMDIKDTQTDVFCCYDNQVRSCKPGTSDESHCNSLCLKHPCGKGGRCKVFGHKHPREVCHCFC